jgi:hypothetical protein
MTDYELIEKAWGYLASYTVGERPNASAVNDLGFILESRLAQPERQWVGLTDEEIKEIIGPWGNTPIKGYTRKLFDQIEAKLREKNGG